MFHKAKHRKTRWTRTKHRASNMIAELFTEYFYELVNIRIAY